MSSYNFSTKGIAELLKKRNSPNEVYINVSSKGEFSQFSPFKVYTQGIPVPGQKDVLSKTVEGIWQGLKVIDDHTAFNRFDSEKPRKRRNPVYEETQFLYGDKLIDIVEARHDIYVPSYTYMFDNLVPTEVKDEIFSLFMQGKNIYFYDYNENSDINFAYTSYSHSALLVSLFKKYSQDKLIGDKL